MASCPIEKQQIRKCLESLRSLENKYEKVHSNVLIFGKENVNLQMQIGLKKTPGGKNHKRIKVLLPHVKLPEDLQVCLFIKDRTAHPKEDHEDTVRYYKKVLQSSDVNNISEVISLKQLKREFKPKEAKIKLCKMFDIFLADERIMKFLPIALGNSFWKLKKFPIGVKLTGTNIKSEIEKNLSCLMINIPPVGGIFTVKLGYVEQTVEELIENSEVTLKSLSATLPGGWDNIRSIYLKTHHVTAIPLYMSTGSSNDVKMRAVGKKSKRVIDNKPEDDYVSLPGIRVVCDSDGKLIIRRDEGDDDVSDIDEDEIREIIEGRKRKRTKSKSKKVDATQSNDEQIEDNDLPDVEVNSEILPATISKAEASRSKKNKINTKQQKMGKKESAKGKKIKPRSTNIKRHKTIKYNK